MSDTEHTTSFEALGMPEFVLKTLSELGYESPSPIQAASIPVFMSGADLIGQAQTGTGKTAAFALPLLAKLEDDLHKPQGLIMAPTRELAIQVAEAFQRYARYRKGFRIAPIYGGQDFRPQLKLLKQGVQVVVGTPGRLLDHLRRGSLDISEVKTLVLDEADEMLRMGFIEDVEEILSHCSGEQQTALFSATMPAPIKRIADKYLTDPQHVVIQAKTATVDRIDQSYWLVDGRQKPEALRRYLETRSFDAMIVFVRTRESASEVAEKVNAWGYRAEAIHGAISQNQREKTINGLKKNKFDILVATDVAARGLDVDRFSHVVNYDIPYDSESYVHRIGRTGRAGRDGEAVLFITQRETRLLKTIERHIKQQITRAQIPNNDVVLQQRVERFKQQVAEQSAKAPSAMIQSVVEQCCHDLEIEPEYLAGVLINMLHSEHPLEPTEEMKQNRERSREENANRRGELQEDEAPIETAPNPLPDYPDVEMERFRIEVGRRSGVKPRDIVGAIANEAGIESTFIGDIILRDEFSTVDLPSGMPKELFNQMKKIRVRGTPIRITRYGKEAPDATPAPNKRKFRDAGRGKEGGKPGGKSGGKPGRKPAAAKAKKFADDRSGFRGSSKGKKAKRS
ncbi:DEAD/DEAH box helicase [Ketobacter sp.]|uniref:DEAD/DEAH box helicase n=1 Tax=Ketobacter sp. TaxID=2083498 RepID=UPI000F240674|nr:DEAD/DEAH box helicase [Ketobacter sp.]RLU01074.1 MAG: DEAD/DEAH box helicase [Ketobacter sp.]